MCVLSCVQVFVAPWAVARQAPFPKELSKQEYWSGVLFPTSGDLSDPGTCSSCVSCFGRRILYHLMPLGKPSYPFNKSILVQWFKTIETSFTVCRLKVQSESYGAKAKHRETRRESVSLSFPACRAAFLGWGPLHL